MTCSSWLWCFLFTDIYSNVDLEVFVRNSKLWKYNSRNLVWHFCFVFNFNSVLEEQMWGVLFLPYLYFPKTFKWWLSILICASFAASKSDCFDEAQAVTVSPTSFICNRTSANLILSRWRLCVEMFGQAFLESVGSEPSSVLNELGRFDVKETKFRREMERLRNSTQRDLTLEVKFCLILFF